mmetsp:Transcript_6287/g.15168  ORF Transcript_6287/g.15168 Transcript_6287/m.15168 type:complete len:455 (+) Transcript_6287:3-1367(+)
MPLGSARGSQGCDGSGGGGVSGSNGAKHDYPRGEDSSAGRRTMKAIVAGGGRWREKKKKGGTKPPPAPFRFKRFSVAHDRCAHRVGADSMLLGAWMVAVLERLRLHRPARVLDIGTGCGVLALMAAQALPKAAVIDAVEMDPASCAQARENFRLSPFADRLHAHQGRIQDFSPGDGYDLILANPPFFFTTRGQRPSKPPTSLSNLIPTPSVLPAVEANPPRPASTRREAARHAHLELPLDDLLSNARRLLLRREKKANDGASPRDGAANSSPHPIPVQTVRTTRPSLPLFFVVFPSDSESQFLSAAFRHGFRPVEALRSCRSNGSPVRTLMALSPPAAHKQLRLTSTRLALAVAARGERKGHSMVDRNLGDCTKGGGEQEEEEGCAGIDDDGGADGIRTNANPPKRIETGRVVGSDGVIIPTTTILIRDADGKYTDAYIDLTKEFHSKDLRGTR